MPGRRLDLVGERVGVAQLDPDARGLLDVGPAASGRRAVHGPQQRVVGRADDAQQRARRAVAVVQPAEALAVVAQPQDLDRQAGQLSAVGEVEQHRASARASAIGSARRASGRISGQQLTSARRSAPTVLRDLHAELLQLGLDRRGERGGRLEPELVLVVEAGRPARC